MLGAIKLGGADQDVAAPAFECWASALGRYVIGDGRTDIAAKRARGCSADQAEPAVPVGNSNSNILVA